MAELIAYAVRTGTKRNLAGIRKLGWRGATSFDGSCASRYAVQQPALGRAVAQQFLVFSEEES